MGAATGRSRQLVPFQLDEAMYSASESHIIKALRSLPGLVGTSWNGTSSAARDISTGIKPAGILI